jgi:hypothetical protein
VSRDDLLGVAAHVALLLLGALLGVWGVFLVPLRLPGGVEGLAVVLAGVTNLAAARLGGFGLGTALAAAMPGIGWLLAVLVLNGLPGHQGDVLVPGRLAVDPGIVVVGTGFLLVGAVAAIAGTVWASRSLGPLATPPA